MYRGQLSISRGFHITWHCFWVHMTWRCSWDLFFVAALVTKSWRRRGKLVALINWLINFSNETLIKSSWIVNLDLMTKAWLCGGNLVALVTKSWCRGGKLADLINWLINFSNEIAVILNLDLITKAWLCWINLVALVTKSKATEFMTVVVKTSLLSWRTFDFVEVNWLPWWQRHDFEDVTSLPWWRSHDLRGENLVQVNWLPWRQRQVTTS